MTALSEPEWAMVSIVFADVRGFTRFAERVTAREALDYLNAFYAAVIPPVEANGGFVYQLLGDGLLATFGAPTPLDSHPDRALAAGSEMLDAVDAQLGDRCRVGVGINTGLVLVGTIGGGGQRRFGVVGDPVNVAARVQEATRDVGQPLLLTEATRCMLHDGGPALQPVGALALEGRSEPVNVHGLAARSADWAAVPGRDAPTDRRTRSCASARASTPTVTIAGRSGGKLQQ